MLDCRVLSTRHSGASGPSNLHTCKWLDAEEQSNERPRLDWWGDDGSQASLKRPKRQNAFKTNNKQRNRMEYNLDAKKRNSQSLAQSGE